MQQSQASPSHSHVPWFVAEPGQTDVLMIVMGIFVVLFVLIVGVLMLHLHRLPMHLAQTEQKVQYEVVAVLALLALFTGEALYWIAALLLAVIDLPDFVGWLFRMAGFVGRIERKQTRNVSEQSDMSTPPKRQIREASS
jgi:hypothetical protein